MALITINGVELPAPSKYDIGIMDINKAERNAKGTMIIERITSKRKIQLSWKYLAKEELQQLYNLVKDTYFDVEYIDPQEGGIKTGTFYAGDRNVGAMDYIDGEIRWKDIKFNIVER